MNFVIVYPFASTAFDVMQTHCNLSDSLCKKQQCFCHRYWQWSVLEKYGVFKGFTVQRWTSDSFHKWQVEFVDSRVAESSCERRGQYLSQSDLAAISLPCRKKRQVLSAPGTQHKTLRIHSESFGFITLHDHFSHEATGTTNPRDQRSVSSSISMAPSLMSLSSFIEKPDQVIMSCVGRISSWDFWKPQRFSTILGCMTLKRCVSRLSTFRVNNGMIVKVRTVDGGNK